MEMKKGKYICPAYLTTKTFTIDTVVEAKSVVMKVEKVCCFLGYQKKIEEKSFKNAKPMMAHHSSAGKVQYIF